MERRDLLKGATAGAAAGGLAAACGGSDAADGPAVHATRRVRWRCPSSFPRGLDTIYGAAEVLAERVAAMTDGAFQIRIYPANDLVGGLEVLDAVQKRSVQMGQTAGYYYIGKNPALAFDTCVPFGLSARQQTAWLLEGGGLELVHELYADFGVVSFPCGNTGAQMGGWFKRPIESPADVRGLKMRIPGFGGEVMDALGASVQVIQGSEVFPALERGAIDAAEWVGPYDDEKLGLHEAAKYYYYPGWWEPGPSLSFLVNLAEWESLPSVYREVFRAASAEAATAMQTRYDMKNPAALARILEHGNELRTFSPEIMAAAREVAGDLMSTRSAADATYRKVHDHWRKAREALFGWFGTAELAYADFAFRSPR